MKNGLVVTFYSYKGGVGRSFALANIGALLAMWGHKVLCVDWDLESPGLSHYFKPYLTEKTSLEIKEKKPQSGILELVEVVKGGESPDWRKFVRILTGLKSKGTLSFMSAGLQNDSYVRRLQSLDWNELYEKHGLGDYIERIREEWKDEYDFIFVDSRTGITDMGGITTIQLPEVLAFFFSANKQSLNGAVDIAKRVLREHKRLPYDRGGLITLPVLSRFDMREEYKKGKEWLGIVEDKVKPFYADWLHKEVSVGKIIEATTIPYMSYWSFGEKLAVLEDPKRDSESINYRLETLAALLAKECSETQKLVDNRDSFVASMSKEEISLKRKRSGEKVKLKVECEKILLGGNVLEWRKLVKRLWSDIPERIIEWKARGELEWKKGDKERENVRLEAVEICLPAFVPIFAAVENGKKDMWEEAMGSLRQMALLRESMRMRGGIVDVIEIGGHMLYIAGNLGMAIAARTKQLDFVNNWMKFPMPATEYGGEVGEKPWSQIYFAHRLWGHYMPGNQEPFRDILKISESDYLFGFFPKRDELEKYLFLANLGQSLFEMGRCLENDECRQSIEILDKKRFRSDMYVWPVWALMKPEEFKSATWELFGSSKGLLDFVFLRNNTHLVQKFWTFWKKWKEICVSNVMRGEWQIKAFRTLRGEFLLLPGEPPGQVNK